jgi:Rod binding domain-containing protein
MESINLLANAPVQTGDSKRASEMANRIADADDKKKMKVAKEFEGILIGQLMNQMKETIGESGLLEDGSSKQVQDMFWSFLADEVAENGGMGLWKNVYESMSPSGQQSQGAQGAEKTNLKIDQTV